MISLNHTQIKPKSLNPYQDDSALCHWVGDGLSGRVVSLYEKKPGVYLEIGKHLTHPENHQEVESCIDLSKEVFFQNLSNEIKEEMYGRYMEGHIPNIDTNGTIQGSLSATVHKWVYQKKTVSLMRKKDQSLLWRVTSGKVHKISLDLFKFVCLFPIANPTYSVNEEWITTNGYPAKLPGLLKNIDPGFLKAHSLNKLKEVPQCTVLEFSPNYPKIRSKFNPEVYVSPYEWGLTLISYTPDRSNLSSIDMGNGHSAILIESVKNGQYHADMVHIVRWSDYKKDYHYHGTDHGINAAKIKIGIASCPVKDPNSSEEEPKYNHVFLQDETVDFAQECFINLHHSPTWIRKREGVNNMLRQVEALYNQQEETKKPVFYFYTGGDNQPEHGMIPYKALGGIAGGVAMFSPLWPLGLLTLGSVVLPDIIYPDSELDKLNMSPESFEELRYREWAKTVQDQSEYYRHNCTSWAIKMLAEADLMIDTGLVKKHIAKMPKDYANLDVKTLTQESPRKKSVWKDILQSQIQSTKNSLYQMFFGTSLVKSKNGFIRPNKLDTNQSALMMDFLDNQFLLASNKKSIQSVVCKSLGIDFDESENLKFISPLMDLVIEEKLLSKKMIDNMNARNIHIDIKLPNSWNDKDGYSINPTTTTYADTLRAILSHYLRIEVCEKILWSLEFPEPSSKFI